MKYLHPAKTLSQREIDQMVSIHYLSSNLQAVQSAFHRLPIADFDIDTIDRLNEQVILLINHINAIMYERNKEAENTPNTSDNCRSAD